MKKHLVIATFLVLLAPLHVGAIAGFFPVDQYGYTNDRAMWSDDTIDANDADLAGDVHWFFTDQATGQILPNAIYISSLTKFNQVAFDIGNSPLQGLPNSPHAVLRFSYPRLTIAQQFEWIPLEVKDLDGGFSRSNQVYRYSFPTPNDWLIVRPHVQARDGYTVKVECVRNCSSVGVGGPNEFKINEVNVALHISLQVPIRNLSACDINPFQAGCISRIPRW